VEEFYSGNGTALELGVVSTVHELDPKKWLDNQAGGWVYCDDGYCQSKEGGNYDDLESRSTFHQGSTVKFILDLTEDGTLSALLIEHPLRRYTGTCDTSFQTPMR
jgi:hypothetical protein